MPDTMLTHPDTWPKQCPFPFPFPFAFPFPFPITNSNPISIPYMLKHKWKTHLIAACFQLCVYFTAADLLSSKSSELYDIIFVLCCFLWLLLLLYLLCCRHFFQMRPNWKWILLLSCRHTDTHMRAAAPRTRPGETTNAKNSTMPQSKQKLTTISICCCCCCVL